MTRRQARVEAMPFKENGQMQTASACTAARIGNADEEFAAEMSRCEPALRAYARRLALGGRADADDLLQDTMLRCWAARHRFEPGSNFAAWARTVMRNRFISDRRRDRYHAELSDDALDRIPGVAAAQEPAVHLRDANRALDELTPAHRDAVVLAGEGLTVQEAAARLDIPEGTYKSRVWRGRLRLRDLTENRAAAAVAVTPGVDLLCRAPERRRDWKGVMIG